ncbi:MAG: hypothetical protein WC627_10955 [Legionella sp.]|jgi:hypothetical protein
MVSRYELLYGYSGTLFPLTMNKYTKSFFERNHDWKDGLLRHAAIITTPIIFAGMSLMFFLRMGMDESFYPNNHNPMGLFIIALAMIVVSPIIELAHALISDVLSLGHAGADAPEPQMEDMASNRLV